MSARIYVGDSGTNREKSLEQAFGFIGLSGELSHASKVFVKPNFTFPRPVPGVTTSQELLETTLKLLSETGVEVFVGESNGGYGSFLASEAFAGHGLRDICQRTHAQMINLSAQETVECSEEVGGRWTTVSLPRILVDEIDFAISVPVLKVHAMTTVSLSLKNLWGCYPTDLRLLEHRELDRKLALISKLAKVRFGLVDAFYGLDEHGPMQGTPRNLGRFIGGNDLVTLDFACARMMGFNPTAILHLRNLARFIRGVNPAPEIQSNEDLSKFNWGFTLHRGFIDTLSFAAFHNDTLAKLVYDSPATKPIYAILGREPRKKLE